MNEETDERIVAWHKVAGHPFFAECYGQEAPLAESMIQFLDSQLTEPKPQEVATRAEEPVEWRVLRAFGNGYIEGLRRGADGRLDH